uniref:Uncharacterized protein n=1 Tax=Crocodylus porosus TaxID=8502 RepID=A0A7M4FBZ4_CROPO
MRTLASACIGSAGQKEAKPWAHLSPRAGAGRDISLPAAKEKELLKEQLHRDAWLLVLLLVGSQITWSWEAHFAKAEVCLLRGFFTPQQDTLQVLPCCGVN